MPESEVLIPFPLKGVDQRNAYQSQPEQSTPSAVNVFADDSQEGRTRGGSRPGLQKRYAENLGASPSFMEAVTTADEVESESYQVLVIATSENVFVSNVTLIGLGTPVVQYNESLSAASGNLATEEGDTLITEEGDTFILTSFALGNVRRGQAVAYKGQILIAGDGGYFLEGTGTITSNVLTSGAVADWGLAGVTLADHVVEITDHLNGRTVAIASLSGGGLTLDATFANGACTFKIAFPPRLFDPSLSTLVNVTPTAGFIPNRADVLSVYRDRLVWADGRTWYMSRQGDPGDYDYGADDTDAGRAVAGVNSDAGQPGDPIIALAPAGYDYLLMFSEDTTWVLRGDPAFGGQIYNLSRMVGAVDSGSWCHGEDGEIYFLSKNGLYRIAANASQPPEPLSKGPLPRELHGISRTSYRITLAYDSRDNAVLVFVSPIASGTGSHWLFDLDTQSFWRMVFSEAGHEPIEAISFSGTPDQPRSVVMACRDGYVRKFFGTTDDGNPISSSIVLGPFVLGQSGSMDGILNAIVGAVDTGSGTVAIEVYVGETAEQVTQDAIEALNPDFASTLTAGRFRTYRPRRRGVAFCLRLSSTEKWSFELLTAAIATAGVKRF